MARCAAVDRFRAGDCDRFVVDRSASNFVSARRSPTGIAVGYGESTPKVVDEQTAKEAPFLKVGTALTEQFINSLPALVVSEMWDKLKEVAPNWGPDFQRPVRRKRKADSGQKDGDGD